MNKNNKEPKGENSWWVFVQTVLKDGIFLQRWNFYAIIADRRQMNHDNTSAEKTANGANHNNNNTDQKKKDIQG